MERKYTWSDNIDIHTLYIFPTDIAFDDTHHILLNNIFPYLIDNHPQLKHCQVKNLLVYLNNLKSDVPFVYHKSDEVGVQGVIYNCDDIGECNVILSKHLE